MIDFPVPTAVGQLFKTGGYTYKWDGSTWGLGGASSITPDAPVDNQQYARKNGAWSVVAASGAVGGGADKVFYENDTTVTTDYTITAGKNAMSAGPITINTGITVTVPSGSVWTVV